MQLRQNLPIALVKKDASGFPLKPALCQNKTVIKVTKLSGEIIYINSRYIISLESTPDSIIYLSNNTKLIVKESINHILANIQQDQQSWTKPALSASL